MRRSDFTEGANRENQNVQWLPLSTLGIQSLWKWDVEALGEGTENAAKWITARLIGERVCGSRLLTGQLAVGAMLRRLICAP